MRVQRMNQQQQRARDPRLDKTQLGWDLQPTQAMMGCVAFVVAVVVLHFTGAIFRS